MHAFNVAQASNSKKPGPVVKSTLLVIVIQVLYCSVTNITMKLPQKD